MGLGTGCGVVDRDTRRGFADKVSVKLGRGGERMTPSKQSLRNTPCHWSGGGRACPLVGLRAYFVANAAVRGQDPNPLSLVRILKFSTHEPPATDLIRSCSAMFWRRWSSLGPVRSSRLEQRSTNTHIAHTRTHQDEGRRKIFATVCCQRRFSRTGL